ncbi:MAG: phosphate ABC transporter ATP-binding protein PstB [Thermaerobacter sp.]|nr:phosphate ABC transporter ATP-binding protein PstB [Thermaerobacter sp.]
MNVGEAALRVEGLSISFGSQKVLSDVTFRVERRSITAIVGPSGQGKSTLLRTFNRMNEHLPGFRMAGRVFLDGEDIYQMRDVVSLRRRVGMVFQRPSPFPMSVFDNVAFGPRLNGVRDPVALHRVVEESLRRAALWDEVDGKLADSAVNLSGGQQQRLCIARALAVEPELLLLDEPASALDPASTLRIEDLCQRLKERYTLVMVTHNLQQAARISDHTAVLLGGRLVEFGETSQVFTAPLDPRTEAYLTGRRD